jgi:hypothetical protein
LRFRANILVDEAIILDVTAVPALIPAYEAQILTYLRMSKIRVGLLLNFHAPPRGRPPPRRLSEQLALWPFVALLPLRVGFFCNRPPAPPVSASDSP